MTTALKGGEGSASRPGRSLPPGKTRYPLYRRLGGPQGRSGQVRKISPSPGFDSRTVIQQVYINIFSRFTNHVYPAIWREIFWNLYFHSIQFFLTRVRWSGNSLVVHHPLKKISPIDPSLKQLNPVKRLHCILTKLHISLSQVII